MSLLMTPGDGLLQSHVEWEDVENLLEERFGSQAKLGPNKSIKPIGADVGLQSSIGVVDPDWVEESEELPKKFVVKIASPIGMINSMDSSALANVPAEVQEMIQKSAAKFIQFLRPCHNAEVEFYDTLNRLSPRPFYIPAMYKGSRFTEENDYKAFELMQYLESVTIIPPTDNFSPDQIKEVLSAWADTTVVFRDVGEEQRAEAPFQGISGVYAAVEDEIIYFYNSLLAQIPHPKIKDLVAKIDKIIPDIISLEEVDNITEKLGMEKVIVHGDFWSNNVLFDENGKLAHIIDFQMSHYGLFATDLTRFLNTATTTEDRRSNWKNYLETYYNALLAKLNGKEPPFTLKQLKVTYRLVYPRTALNLIIPLVALFQNVQKIPNAEVQGAAFAKLVPKTIGILEDILFYHNHKQPY